MAFEDGVKKGGEEKSTKSVQFMTLYELEQELQRHSQNLGFAGLNASERTKKNCNYIQKWTDMSVDEFERRVKAARSNKKDIYETSGAIKDGNSMVWPEDDAGQLLTPTLYTIIGLQLERLRRVNYAKGEADMTFDSYGATKNIARELSTDSR